MTIFRRARAAWVMVVLTMLSIVGVPAIVSAVEVGEAAPGFTLPATTGGDVSLGDYKGKKFVLLEFYGADFAPT